MTNVLPRQPHLSGPYCPKCGSRHVGETKIDDPESYGPFDDFWQTCHNCGHETSGREVFPFHRPAKKG